MMFTLAKKCKSMGHTYNVTGQPDKQTQREVSMSLNVGLPCVIEELLLALWLKLE